MPLLGASAWGIMLSGCACVYASASTIFHKTAVYDDVKVRSAYTECDLFSGCRLLRYTVHSLLKIDYLMIVYATNDN